MKECWLITFPIPYSSMKECWLITFPTSMPNWNLPLQVLQDVKAFVRVQLYERELAYH